MLTDTDLTERFVIRLIKSYPNNYFQTNTFIHKKIFGIIKK